MPAGQLDHLLMAQIAGGGDDHVFRRVMRVHEAVQRLALHVADDRLGAQHRAAHRLRGVGGGLEMVEHDVVRRVIGLADFLQDHAALALQLFGLEGRVAEDIADDVDAEAEIFLQQLDVIGGLLARGIGVDMAADILDRLGDVDGRAGGRCP